MYEEGEIVLGAAVESGVMELVRIEDNVITVKALVDGESSVVITTNQGKYDVSVTIEPVSRVELNTYCNSPSNVNEKVPAYVVAGASLRTSYSLHNSSVNNIPGRGYLELPISAEESYNDGSSNPDELPAATLTYTVPDDAKGNWSLEDKARGVKIVDVDVVEPSMVDQFAFFDLYAFLSEWNIDASRALRMEKTTDLVVKPQIQDETVCGMDPSSFTVTSATPDVCSVEPQTEGLKDVSERILYQIVSVNGISAGDCELIINKSDGSEWARTVLPVK